MSKLGVHTIKSKAPQSQLEVHIIKIKGPYKPIREYQTFWPSPPLGILLRRPPHPAASNSLPGLPLTPPP